MNAIESQSSDLRFESELQHQGMRVDRFLQESCEEYSRTMIQRWFDAGLVCVENNPVKKSHLLKPAQVITVREIPETPSSLLEPEAMDLDIRYLDDDLAVLFKPKGLVVHPGSGIQHGTLAAGLLHHFQELSGVNGPARPGIVHRLDRDTSGLMVVARNDFAHAALAQQLQDRSLRRVYRALVWGQPEDEGVVDAPLDRDAKNRLKRAVSQNGKAARTHWKVLERFETSSFLELRLETGRTHQIRVHMSHLGHPILGDVLYGGGTALYQRTAPLLRPRLVKAMDCLHSQALMAQEISFLHPRDQKRVVVEAELEGEIQNALQILRGQM
jgi:23S rRNA pseudouridine1911/1915/1917 synthase